MDNTKDLIGKTFGYWYVLSKKYIKNDNNKIIKKWHCKCKCGTEKDVLEQSLICGSSLSCGCYNKEKTREKLCIDLTGQQFGNWKVLRKGTSRNKMTYFVCECACEKHIIKEIRSVDLRNGISIGCKYCARKIRPRTKKDKDKIRNKYDLSNDYGIGFLNTGEEFYFDKEDYEIIKDYHWNDSLGYITTKSDENKTIRFHRLVMNVTNPKLHVDHINHNTKDNRKINLRIVSASLNGENSKLRKNNTSGCTGVYWASLKNKWKAVITVNEKLISLGSYDDYNSAVEARKRAEEKYFGEYSYDNSMKYAETFEIKEEKLDGKIRKEKSD